MMRHMILGLLRHHGVRHGYALMKEIRARTGVHASIGNIYRELARLAREGLARSTPNPPEADPRRAPYEITAAGIAAFEAWLSATPTKTQAPFHDEFSARAFFLGQAEPAVGRKLIERWREELAPFTARVSAVTRRTQSRGAGRERVPRRRAHWRGRSAASVQGRHGGLADLDEAPERLVPAPRRPGCSTRA